MKWLLLSMLAGLLAGRALRRRRPGAVAQRGVTLCVWTLLFLLGLAVGGNVYVMARLGTLGVEALVLTVGCVVGSGLLAGLVGRWAGHRRKGGEKP